MFLILIVTTQHGSWYYLPLFMFAGVSFQTVESFFFLWLWLVTKAWLVPCCFAIGLFSGRLSPLSNAHELSRHKDLSRPSRNDYCCGWPLLILWGQNLKKLSSVISILEDWDFLKSKNSFNFIPCDLNTAITENIFYEIKSNKLLIRIRKKFKWWVNIITSFYLFNFYLENY